jgi:hypothetical protein
MKVLILLSLSTFLSGTEVPNVPDAETLTKSPKQTITSCCPTLQVFPFEAGDHWPQQIDGKKMDTYHRWIEVAVVQLAYSHQQARQWVSKHRVP